MFGNEDPTYQKFEPWSVDGEEYRVVGVIAVLQIPLLDLLGFISATAYWGGLLISIVLIYAMTALAGLYPSWLATMVRPAQALHCD